MPRRAPGQGALVVYSAILRNPGVSVAGLARIVHRDASTVEHHVHRLERKGLVVSERAGRVRVCWTTGHRLQGVTRDA